MKTRKDRSSFSQGFEEMVNRDVGCRKDKGRWSLEEEELTKVIEKDVSLGWSTGPLPENLRAQNVFDEFFQPVKPTLGQNSKAETE
ncbi:hypothetical protein LWI28_028641 [Acer negundo]|uniref:Uncharacterized protein n=1 Tax=Acer negundo TaxID=4023 RepID=A0AAD5NTB8_ACENE|nr:hypothetical protein LWI28_028641 [Acer negundo]